MILWRRRRIEEWQLTVLLATGDKRPIGPLTEVQAKTWYRDLRLQLEKGPFLVVGECCTYKVDEVVGLEIALAPRRG